MDFEKLKKFIEKSRFAKRSFSIEELYQLMQPLVICPTFEELSLIILNAYDKGHLKHPSHQSKLGTKKYMLSWKKKLGVPGTIEAIRNCLINHKQSPLRIPETVRRCPQTYSTTCRSVIYILRTLGIIDQTKEKPQTISWNEEKSNYFLSDDENCFRRRLKLLINLQLMKKRKSEELAMKLSANRALRRVE